MGPCNTAKPGMLEFVAKAKWNAWKELGAMPKDTAVATYVAELEKVSEWMRGTAGSMEHVLISLACCLM